MEIENKIQLMQDAIRLLETAVDAFSSKIGPPLFISENDKKRFQYLNPSPLHLQVLRAVRIVSGLNASICLLEKGYVQEIGVLLRTVDEFICDIEFLQEAYETGKPTIDQQKFINEFFSKKFLTTKERIENPKKPYMLPRQKVYAAIGRLLGQFNNPSRTIVFSKIIDESLSGYVHGAYNQIMELYEGGKTERFQMQGMFNTPRIPVWQWEIACYTHRALNTFVDIAVNMNFPALKQKLLEKRREFEKSEAYKRG